MSREVLIPVAFVAVVVLRLTMMLVFVPKRRRDGVRSSGAAPLAPAADREPKERSARARASAAAKNASDSSRRQVEPCTVVLGYDGHIGRTRIRTRDRGGRQRGRVVVVTARLHTEGDPWEQEFDAPLIQEPARLLDDAAILLQSHDVTVSTRAGGGDPAEALITVARETNAALIVVGARGDDYLARALRGSVGERLVARAPYDLLVAR